MTIEITAIITGVGIILVSGAIIAINKHIGNSEKHPCKKDIVFRDVCKSEMKGLRDCFEVKLASLEKITKQGFENLERLIRNGGKDE